MSKFSRFLYKARNKADLSGLRAGIKLIVMILVVVYSLVGMNSISVSAVGTTYYVNNTVPCNDSGPGSLALPYCTIGKAATVALAGSTINVLAGTYAESVTPTHSGSLGSLITFSAASGVTVTGAVAADAFHLSGVNYITINGFTVSSTATNGIYTDTGSHITISNNTVTHSNVNGIYVLDSNNATISNNTVSTSGLNGIYLKGSSISIVSGNISNNNDQDGIRLNGSTIVTVSNNTTFANKNNGIAAISTSYINTILHNIVYANWDTGLQFDTFSHDNSVIGNLSYGNGDHGIDNQSAPNQMIIGNTFQGNYTSGINLMTSSTGATIENNILVDNGLAPLEGKNRYNLFIDSTSFTGTTLDYNLYYLNAPYNQQIWWNTTGYTSLGDFQAVETTQEVHGLEAAPLLFAPVPYASYPPSVEMGDYHLKAGSPAIDSANSNLTSEPTTDLAGNARVDDPLTTNTGAGTRTYDDRGAYEFQFTITTVATSGTPSIYGDAVTFTATVTPNTVSNGTTIQFYDGAILLGTGTISGTTTRTASYTTAGTQLSAGTHASITAKYLGNSAFGPSTSTAILQVVNPKAQTITFGVLSPKTLGAANFPVSATASSGLTVSFTSTTPGVCTVTTGGIVHLVTTGTCTITAQQAGDTNYYAAPDVSQNFLVTDKLIPTVTVDCGTNTVTYGDSMSCTVTVARPSGSFTPTGDVAWTTSGAGGFGVTTPCTLSTTGTGIETCSATYTPAAVGTGTHTITATYAGDAKFLGIGGSMDVKVNNLTIFLPLILR